MTREDTLLEAKGLRKHFVISRGLRRHVVTAVDGIDLEIPRGSIVSLVGESGSGKSTTGRLLAGLLVPTTGDVWFDGRRVSVLKRREMRGLWRSIQMIFQDPYTSLNPRKTLRHIIGSPLINFGLASRAERDRKVIEMLEAVGLEASHLERYPHEFSGGQRQRISLARALVVRPEVLICDEPLSALDVSVQAQIINLLKELRQRLDLTLLMISHDLAVVKYLSDAVAVMYQGRIVEQGPKDVIFADPVHPYTCSLLAAVPEIDHAESLADTGVEVALSEAGSATGCAFAPRCPWAEASCASGPPELRRVRGDRLAACFLAEERKPERIRMKL